MKKRAIASLLCLTTIISFIPLFSQPAEAAISLPYYRDHVFYNARTGDVTGFEATNSISTNYVIQDTVNGHRVTKICADSFWSVLPSGSTCTISVPNSVKTIENGAFGDEHDIAKIENIVCADNSAAKAFAKANNIKTLTPEQNQRLISSKTFSKKSLTVKINTKDAGDRSNNYISAKDAVITVFEPDNDGNLQENKQYTVPKSGVVEIKASDAASIRVTRAGGVKITGISGSKIDLFIGEARPWEKPFKDIKDEETIYLEQKTDKIYIKSITATLDVDGTPEEYDVFYEGIIVDTFSSESIKITADVDWNEHGAGSISLYQDGHEKLFAGNQIDTVLSEDGYDIRGDISLKVVGADGTQVIKPVKIDPIEGWLDEWLNGSGLSFMGGASLTMPDKIPFAGGSSISIDKLDLPVDIGYEDAKIYVSINALAFESSRDYKETDPKKSKDKSLKLLGFEKLKKAVNGEDEKTLRQLWKDAKEKSATGSKSGSFSFDVIGYLECTVRPDKNIKFSDGQIIVQAGYKFSTSGQFPAPVTFLYWEFYFKVDGEGKLSLCQIINPDGIPLRPYGSVSIQGAIGVGGGVGARKVLSAGVGGEGSTKVTFTWKNAGTFYNWGGKFDVYAHANLLTLEWKKAWTVAQGTWMEGRIGGEKPASLAWDMTELQGAYDISQYTVQDQSYLDSGMDFEANKVSLFSESNPLTSFAENVYNMPGASIAQLDNGTQLMIWIAGAKNRSNGNKTAVYYSVRPENDVWTTPEMIWDDGTADFHPVLAVSGNKAYVAWQNFKEEVDTSGNVDNDSAMEMAEKCEIAVARFTNGTFDMCRNITDDQYYDCCPVLSAESGMFELAWLRDENNSVLGDSDKMCVLHTSNISDKWTVPTEISTNGMIGALDITGAGEHFRYAYTYDMDADVNTTADLEIYLNGSRLTDNDYADDLPCFAGEKLYWIHEGILCCEDNPNSSIVGEDIILSSNDTRVYDNKNGKRVVVYSGGSDVNNGAKAEVYGVFLDDNFGTCSAPVTLTNSGNNMQCGIGYYQNQSLVLPCAETKVTGSIAEIEDDDLPFGRTDLKVLDYSGDSSLSISDVYVDYDRAVPGNNYCLNVEVQNTGALTTNSYSVILWDTNKNMPDDIFESEENPSATVSDRRIVAEMLVNEPLAGGGRSVSELWFRLPDSNFAGEYEVTVTPTISTGFDENAYYSNADDRKNVRLYSEDLLVEKAEALGIGDGESMSLNALIANVGMNTQDNVKVNLYSLDQVEMEDEDGETQLQTQKTLRDSSVIPTLGSGDHVTVSFERTIEECDSYMFEIEEGNGEACLTNNEFVCAVNIGGDKEDGLTVNVSINGNDYQLRNDVSGVCTVYAAIYNSSGKMLDTSSLERKVNDAEVNIDMIVADLPEQYTIKVMCVDDQMNPITEEMVREVK